MTDSGQVGVRAYNNDSEFVRSTVSLFALVLLEKTSRVERGEKSLRLI